MIRPFLKVAGKFLIGHDVNPVNAAMGVRLSSTYSIIGLPATGQQRFGLCQGERIQSRGVSGGKDDDFMVVSQF